MATQSNLGVIAGISGVAAFKKLIKDPNGELEKFAKSAAVQKEIEYFTKKAATVKDVEAFVKDRRLLAFALSAFTLDGDINNPGRVKRILESDMDDQKSLANRMADPRYQEITKAFEFSKGMGKLQDASFLKQLTDKYVLNEFEKSLGKANPALREAAYFLRKADEVKNAYNILGDNVLRSVSTSVLNLPAQVAVQSLGKQVELIEKGIKISELANSATAAKTASSNYKLTDAQKDVSTLGKNQLVITAAVMQVQDIDSRLQAIQDDYDRLANIQSPTGPFAGEFAVQEAAVPELVRFRGLLAAAADGLDVVNAKLGRMQELIGLANDPANAGSLADFKAEFATLATEIQDAVAGSTYLYDDADPDDIGTAQNLLDGTQPAIQSVQIKSTGEAVQIRGHDLSGFLSTVSAMNASFQAATGAGDTANLGAAQASLVAASEERAQVAQAVGVDDNILTLAIDSVPQWAATLQTDSLYQGAQAVRDAESRASTINVLFSQIRALAELGRTMDPSEDRTELEANFASLVEQVQVAIGTTTSSGVANLLSGPDTTAELIGGQHFTVRGRDLATSIGNPLAALSLADAGTSQQVIDLLDGSAGEALVQAQRELKVDGSFAKLAAETLDPRAKVDSAFRKLTDELTSMVAKANISGKNLLANYQSDISIRVASTGRTITLNAQENFQVDVVELGKAAANLLPSDSLDSSGALAAFRSLKINVGRALTELRAGQLALDNELKTAKQMVTDLTTADSSTTDVYAASDYTKKLLQRFLIQEDAKNAGLSTGGAGAKNGYVVQLLSGAGGSTSILS
ncbi:MAG: hypothetical protein OHK0024_20280 [Thalassobaculales bacterium]